ncbi:aldo/keto reductase [Kaistia dalseonensis]|uniref:Oxidoreductase n=1 Tax=Kaistia dalseonensis TaxID=410840 RepID=A0ABU0H4V9_9HYPH|nr:aldo/keto reductase [Kaistia dalseonensis]MCX5494764.1 aldo/keto reductase [Kaistia dalseonensis]MDQ0437345.1 putative oxidoreductase [Kaistia dalseonensis]
MHTIKIANSDMLASRIILGLMRISKLEDRAIRSLYEAARAAGVTIFDHADIYGGAPHECERRFGEAVSLTSAERADIIVQSKVGIRPGYFDFSSEHILQTVDRSLAALRTDYLDVLLLHRPDALVEPEEVAGAFDALHAAGKVRHFGVSNHTPGQIDLLKTAVKQPLVINQIQLSITHAPTIASGVAANMADLDQSIDRDNEIINYARINGITLQAWSPFQKRFFDGVFLGDHENYPELNHQLELMASKYAVTPAAIAVAWIARHPANIQIVLGTTNPNRLAESAAGADIVLDRQEWYRLFTAAGYTLP